MTILTTEGFDHEYNTFNPPVFFGWQQANAAVGAAGRFGGSSMSVSNPSGPITYTHSSNLTTAYLGAAVQFNTELDDVEISFMDGGFLGNYQVTVKFDSNTQTVSAWRGNPNSGGTLLGSSGAGVYPQNAWRCVEIAVTIDGTNGSVAVYIEDSSGFVMTQVLSVTGANTKSTANSFFNNVQFKTPGSGNAFTIKVDDAYLRDDALNGIPWRVITLRGAANGTTTQWTPLASTNVSQINETYQDGETSYNSSGTVGNKDTFTTGGISYHPAAIFGVSVKMFAERDSFSSAISAQTRLRSGSTEAAGAANALTNTALSNYTGFKDRFDTDPASGGAWTVGAVNAMEIGYDVASSAGGVNARVTQVVAEVMVAINPPFFLPKTRPTHYVDRTTIHRY